MTPRPLPPDELLSACHDGEATPAERAEVDRLLAESPALRETLDDYRELSSLLQTLPRPSAPAGLQAGVLRRVQAQRSPAAAAAPRRRPWLWGVSLAATAALLMVLVWHRGQPESRTGQHAESDLALLKQQPGTESQPVETAAASAPAVQPIPSPAPEATGMTTFGQSSDRLGLPRAVPAMPSAAQFAPAMTPAEGLLEAEALAERLVLDPRSPPQVEEVLAYVDRVGGETLIIEFDVLDVDRTADDMLILLQRRGMSVVGATEASPTSPLTAEESLVALYVEAPESQLAAVMDDLLLQVDITEGAAFNEEAAGPLMKDRLQQFEQRSITFDRRDNARSAEPVPILSAASPVPDQPSALPPQAPSPPRMAARATSQMKMADAQEPEETPGQAVRLSLPAGVYQQMETRVESPEQAQSRRMMPSRAAPFSAAAPAAPPAEEDAEGDSFQRVLFVLQRDAAR